MFTKYRYEQHMNTISAEAQKFMVYVALIVNTYRKYVYNFSLEISNKILSFL